MKHCNSLIGGGATIICGFLVAGCASPQEHTLTSPYHPGPVVGQTLGTGVGVVGGNVAGAGVGFTEGVVKGAAAPFNNTTRVVRHWHTETTADGRTIQVPEDILVDAYGRPVVTAAKPAPNQSLVSPKNQ